MALALALALGHGGRYYLTAKCDGRIRLALLWCRGNPKSVYHLCCLWPICLQTIGRCFSVPLQQKENASDEVRMRAGVTPR
jgi:hypothetical protein